MSLELWHRNTGSRNALRPGRDEVQLVLPQLSLNLGELGPVHPSGWVEPSEDGSEGRWFADIRVISSVPLGRRDEDKCPETIRTSTFSPLSLSRARPVHRREETQARASFCSLRLSNKLQVLGRDDARAPHQSMWDQLSTHLHLRGIRLLAHWPEDAGKLGKDGDTRQFFN